MIGIDPDRPEMRAAQGEYRSFGRIAAIGVFVPQKIYLMKTGKEGKGDRTMDETNVNDRQTEQAQDRLLFFRLAEDGEELCGGTCYQALLDYMAARCDRFMLAYVLADGEKMSAEMRHIEQQLRPYRLFYRRTGGWPGAIFDHSITGAARPTGSHFTGCVPKAWLFCVRTTACFRGCRPIGRRIWAFIWAKNAAFILPAWRVSRHFAMPRMMIWRLPIKMHWQRRKIFLFQKMTAYRYMMKSVEG